MLLFALLKQPTVECNERPFPSEVFHRGYRRGREKFLHVRPSEKLKWDEPEAARCHTVNPKPLTLSPSHDLGFRVYGLGCLRVSLKFRLFGLREDGLGKGRTETVFRFW